MLMDISGLLHVIKLFFLPSPTNAVLIKDSLNTANVFLPAAPHL